MKRSYGLLAALLLFSTGAFAEVTGAYKSPQGLFFLVVVEKEGTVLITDNSANIPGILPSGGLNIWGYGVGTLDPGDAMTDPSTTLELIGPQGLCKVLAEFTFTSQGLTQDVMSGSATALGESEGVDCSLPAHTNMYDRIF